MEAERWLSVDEISEHIGLSKETVYRWIEKKRIPAHRIGKLWKFKASEVDLWVLNGDASGSDALKNPKSRRVETKLTKNLRK